MNEHFGTSEGELCGRKGCKGIISVAYDGDGCSCHINPPCCYCTSSHYVCNVCGWNEQDEVTQTINDYTVKIDKKTGVYKSWELRKLDPTKVDWHSLSHTHFTMIKRGVYPEPMTPKEVLAVIGAGTFGGRFNYFGNGKFEYVAYTD